ncbi:hypothetical protein EDB19DRAFT_1832026 [Suillus lakei]|nr:hypothetical protein EDB19DRAFT_1832026 [Suillus lakei]
MPTCEHHLALINTTPHPAGSSADQIPVEAWAPLPAPIAGSANDHQVASYRGHAPHCTGITSNGGPFVATTTTGANTHHLGNTTSHHQPSGPFLQSSQHSQNVHTACDSITFKVVLIPYPICVRGTLMIDSEEPLPSSLKLSRQKLPDLYRRLDSHHLIIKTTVTVGDSVILDQLDSQINTHFSCHNICFPSSLYGDHQPTSGSLEYEKLDLVILELGKLSANQNTQLLKMALFTSRDITGNVLSVLLRKIAMTMKNPIDDIPLLFIGMIDSLFAPRFGILRGNIVSEPQVAGTVVHPCFAAHVMDTFFTKAIPEPSQEPRCLSSCPLQFDDLSDSDDDSLSMNISELIYYTPIIIRRVINIYWANYIQVHGPRETSTVIPWRVRALNIELGALALIVFIEAQHSCTIVNLSGEKFEGTQIGFTPGNDGSDMNLSSLFMADCTFKVAPSGEGIGLGVERAVISRVIKIVLDEHYMWQKLAPDTAASLAALPLDPAQLLDYSLTGPLSPLLATYSNIQLTVLQLTQLPANMSVEQCMELVGQVYANAFLGCPPRAALDMLKEVYYFCQGFDVTFSNDACITSPSQVIEQLEFEVALVRWPDDCVPESERNSQEGSLTFRAVQLLLSISGNCCLPTDPTQKIIFCFVKNLPVQHTYVKPARADDSWEPLLPVQFQTFTSALMAALAGELPEDDDIVTLFDLWAHLTLFPLSAKGPAHFNTS